MKLKSIIFIGFALLINGLFKPQLLAIREMKGPISFEIYEIDPAPVNHPVIRTIDANGDISYKADLATFEGAVSATKHTTSFSGAIQYSPLAQIHTLPNASAEKWYNYLQKEYDKQKQKLL